MNRFAEMCLLLTHWALNVVSVCCLISAVVGAMYDVFTSSKIVILVCSYVLFAAAKLFVEMRLPDRTKIIKVFDI